MSPPWEQILGNKPQKAQFHPYLNLNSLPLRYQQKRNCSAIGNTVKHLRADWKRWEQLHILQGMNLQRWKGANLQWGETSRYICNKAWLRSFNPLHHNISMHILHTVHHTFLKVLTRRIWLSIKSFFSWWSFPSLLRPSCMIQKRYCKEKLDFIHIKGLNTNRLLVEPKLNRMKITSNDNIHFCACLFKTCLPYLGIQCMNNFILTCFLSC